MEENWEKEGLFKNRPHTTLIFEKQMDCIFYWLGEWGQLKKCQFMESLLRVCNHTMMRFLWTVLEPVVHRDFVYNQFEPSPESKFFTLSSYVTRELYARLEKIVNKYKVLDEEGQTLLESMNVSLYWEGQMLSKASTWNFLIFEIIERKKREVYRIPSSVLKNEEEVKYWTNESVLPVIKGHGSSDVIGSKSNVVRSKIFSTSFKSTSTLPTISSCRTMTWDKRPVAVKRNPVNAVPLRYQTKQRHLQRDEAFSCSSPEVRSDVFKSCHERSHLKTSMTVRSSSTVEMQNLDLNDSHLTEFQRRHSLGILSAGLTERNSGDKFDCKHLTDWFQNKWNDWQRKEFLQLFLQTLDTTQTYLLYGLITVRLYRDLISTLPRHLSIKILSYLPPADLLRVAKVSRKWEELASSDELWKQKCEERKVSYRTSISWKDTFLRYENLDDNWRKGRFTVTEFLGHTASVTTVQTFKNLLASGSVDKTIKIWNLQSGDLIQTLRGHSKGVWGLRFMSKTLLISCSNDQTIKIWNLRIGSCARTFLGHLGGIFCIQQKGDLLVSGSVDKTARLWNLRHCRMKSTFVGHAGAVFGVDFDPDRGELFTGSADKTVRMWSLKTAECLKCIMVSTNMFPVTCIGYHEGVLACCFGNTISLWNTDIWENTVNLEGHRERIEAFQISPKETNGNRPMLVVVSCSRDGKVKCWDALNASCINSFRAHDDAITSLVFDETKIITASQDCSIKLWNFLS